MGLCQDFYNKETWREVGFTSLEDLSDLGSGKPISRPDGPEQLDLDGLEMEAW